MDAEDALSRAMLKAFEKLPAHANKIVSLRAWLMSFTHNVCMDIHRERARVGLHVANIESSEAAMVATETNIESPDCAVARLEQRARLLWAVKNLAPRLRDPFILRFLHDMNYEVIAARLGLTPANVRKRIQQARERLRETLNKSA